MRVSSLASRFVVAGILSAVFVRPAAAQGGPDVRDTRLLSEPAISADRIAFIYAGDLWTCDLDGRDVRRLTADVGRRIEPRVLSGRALDRVLGAVRGEHRRLRRRRRGRRARAG